MIEIIIILFIFTLAIIVWRNEQRLKILEEKLKAK